MIFRRASYQDQPFTTIPNILLRGAKEAKASERRLDNLSAESLGVLVYLLSHDTSWKVTNTQLAKVFGMTKARVTKICRELESAGYAQRNILRNEKGTLLGWDWNIFDNCDQIKDIQDVENQELRKTIVKEKSSEKKKHRKKIIDEKRPNRVTQEDWDRWIAHKAANGNRLPSDRVVANAVLAFERLVTGGFDVSAVVSLSILKKWQSLGDPSWDVVQKFKNHDRKNDLLGAVK